MAPTLFDAWEDPLPSRASLEDARGRRSLGDVLDASADFANELESLRGPLAGTRVVLQGEPSSAWLVAFLAVVRSGGVVVPVAMGAPGPELRYFVDDSHAKLGLVTHEGPAAFPDDLEVVRAPTLGDPRPRDASRARAPRPSSPVRPEDPALVLYTSGTTGKPKGAVSTHDNLRSQTEALREAWAIRSTDVLLHTLPMHHLHGIVVALLTSLSARASVVMLPRFEPLRVMAALGQATVFMAVPTMYQRLFEAYDACEPEAAARFTRAAASLRLATSGSAALPRSLAERWREITGSIPLERYGMTEIGIALSNTLDPEGRRAGSVGRPLPSVELRIVDDAGRDADGAGELWVRGPSVFAGYLGRPEATEAAFRDGWFMTGDIGERDGDGVVTLKGRASVDILKSGGEKISALELEETLRDHPAVAEVAVVGVADVAWGDRVVAAIVARAGREAECSEALIRAWAKERLAPFKVPREVRLFPALPRNAMGKVLKTEIARICGETAPDRGSR